MAKIEAFIKHLLNKATVVYKSKLPKAVYHIRIQSESMKDAEFVPGYFLRVAVGLDNNDLSIKDKIRSYSVWNINKNQGIIDLAIATESQGPGVQRVEKCKANGILYFAWHKGKFLVGDTVDSYLMIDVT